MHRQILYASALADAWCWFGGRPRATPALFRAFPERKVALTATDAQLTAAQSKAAARAKKKKKKPHYFPAVQSRTPDPAPGWMAT